MIVRGACEPPPPNSESLTSSKSDRCRSFFSPPCDGELPPSDPLLSAPSLPSLLRRGSDVNLNLDVVGDAAGSCSFAGEVSDGIGERRGGAAGESAGEDEEAVDTGLMVPAGSGRDRAEVGRHDLDAAWRSV